MEVVHWSMFFGFLYFVTFIIGLIFGSKIHISTRHNELIASLERNKETKQNITMLERIDKLLRKAKEVDNV